MAYVVGKEPFSPDLSAVPAFADQRKKTMDYLSSNQHFQDYVNSIGETIATSPLNVGHVEVMVHNAVDDRVADVFRKAGYAVVHRPDRAVGMFVPIRISWYS